MKKIVLSNQLIDNFRKVTLTNKLMQRVEKWKIT